MCELKCWNVCKLRRVFHISTLQERGGKRGDFLFIFGSLSPSLIRPQTKGVTIIMILYADELREQFEPLEPMSFYREIFPEGELDEWREYPLDSVEHRYTGIALEIEKQQHIKSKPLVKRYKEWTKKKNNSSGVSQRFEKIKNRVRRTWKLG